MNKEISFINGRSYKILYKDGSVSRFKKISKDDVVELTDEGFCFFPAHPDDRVWEAMYCLEFDYIDDIEDITDNDSEIEEFKKTLRENGFTVK